MNVKDLICLLVEEDMHAEIAIQVGNSYEHIDGIAPSYCSPSNFILLVPDNNLAQV